MVKVMFVVFYDDAALGLRSMSNLLVSRGHESVIVHFKLPSAIPIDAYPQNPKNVQFVDSQGVLHGCSIDVDPWTETETSLLLAFLERERPDILGISSRSNYDDEVIELVSEMRKHTQAHIIAGGFGPTYDPEAYLEVCDSVCIGEGEEPMIRLADGSGDRPDMAGIPNLAWRDNGRTIRNPLADPEITPHSRRDTGEHTEKIRVHVVDNNELYVSKSPNIRDSDYYVLAGRGCINGCVYCTTGQWYKLYQKEFSNFPRRRNRKVEDIIDELSHIADDYPRIYFHDSFLLGSASFLIKLFNEYKKSIHLPFMATLDYFQILSNPHILELACEAGLSHTVIGIQSASERIRKQVFQRRESDELFLQYAELMDTYDIVKDFHIISHNPYESPEDLEEGYVFLEKLSGKNANIDFMRLQILKGSPLAMHPVKEAQYERTPEENQRIIYKQMARLFGSRKDFEEIDAKVEEEPAPFRSQITEEYPHIFKPYRTGYTNVLMDAWPGQARLRANQR